MDLKFFQGDLVEKNTPTSLNLGWGCTVVSICACPMVDLSSPCWPTSSNGDRHQYSNMLRLEYCTTEARSSATTVAKQPSVTLSIQAVLHQCTQPRWQSDGRPASLNSANLRAYSVQYVQYCTAVSTQFAPTSMREISINLRPRS